jgi:hypothetical protein
METLLVLGIGALVVLLIAVKHDLITRAGRRRRGR